MTLLKLLLLTLILNLLRYFVFGFVEQLFIFGPLFDAMSESSSYFRTEFSDVDWVTSYAYNFVMWYGAVYGFHRVHTHLKGTTVVRSLKVFGFVLLLFLSVSAIYMNHYSHPRDFYLWNMLDAAIIFPLVGIANGLLYPLFRFSPKND